jgi:hypothetical protein|tara:strand:- start:152 stop:478 length:327 start_codon:yes stop_codon:yes gene_type:complete
MNENVIPFPKSKLKGSQKQIKIRERNRKIMAANAIVESMSRKFIYNIQQYDLDKHLSEKDDKWLEDNINVMLSVIQCVTYKCIGEKHPLEKLLQNIAKKLNEDRENDS